MLENITIALFLALSAVVIALIVPDFITAIERTIDLFSAP